MKRLIILIFVLSFSPVLRADLKPVFLSIKLSSPKSTYINGEILPFSVEFQNKDVGKRPVILPGNQKEGKKIIYFSFFSVKDNFYSEVYREATEIAMDTLTKGWVDFRYLKAGEKFSIPVIFNDEKNFSQHIEAHHKLPNLPIGEYQVLAWYQPWTNELSPYAFNPISDFKQTETLRDSTRFDIPIEGTQSNYLTINISNTYQ